MENGEDWSDDLLILLNNLLHLLVDVGFFVALPAKYEKKKLFLVFWKTTHSFI